jgi:hypothetical protein
MFNAVMNRSPAPPWGKHGISRVNEGIKLKDAQLHTHSPQYNNSIIVVVVIAVVILGCQYVSVALRPLRGHCPSPRWYLTEYGAAVA